jgi:small-conductance mechanosensitive channel
MIERIFDWMIHSSTDIGVILIVNATLRLVAEKKFKHKVNMNKRLKIIADVIVIVYLSFSIFVFSYVDLALFLYFVLIYIGLIALLVYDVYRNISKGQFQ